METRWVCRFTLLAACKALPALVRRPPSESSIALLIHACPRLILLPLYQRLPQEKQIANRETVKTRSETDGRLRLTCRRAQAFFGPTVRTPGMLSAASPTRPVMSTSLSGGRPCSCWMSAAPSRTASISPSQFKLSEGQVEQMLTFFKCGKTLRSHLRVCSKWTLSLTNWCMSLSSLTRTAPKPARRPVVAHLPEMNAQSAHLMHRA